MKRAKRCASESLLRAVFFSLICILGVQSAWAEPAAGVSPLRRLTLLVEDPAPMLAFYRDQLGFSVGYDVMVEDPAQLQLLGLNASRARAISLIAPGLGELAGGTLGLAQVWTDAELYRPSPGAGLALMFRTGDAAGLFRSLQASGVTVVAPPSSYEESLGPTTAFTVRDPAGNRVTFAQVAGDESADLRALMDWMSGDFDNRRQIAAQGAVPEPAFSLLGVLRRKVDVPVLGSHVIYAQINNDADPARIYRQRLFVFEPGAQPRTISMTTWSFTDEAAQRDILARLDDLSRLPASAFTPSLPESCLATWHREGDTFVGRVDRQRCVITSSRTGKPRRIQSTEFISATGIRNEESGYEEDGRMIFGVPDGQYYIYDRRP